jgi:prepilin-type N-terminal cleavage/methylation domain-containing protein
MQTNQKGITLVELLAVVVVFGLISTLTYQMLFSLTKQTNQLETRNQAYNAANTTAQAILNNVYDMQLEKSEPCGQNCYSLINREKYYLDSNGVEQSSAEVRYTLRILGGNLELIDDGSNVIISQAVSSNSTITSTCSLSSCLEAVITLDLYFDLSDGTQYQSITTLSH